MSIIKTVGIALTAFVLASLAPAQTITTLYQPGITTVLDSVPAGIAVRPTGGFAVTLPKSKLVRLYTATGQLERSFGVAGRPVSVAVLNGGDLLVGDARFGEVARYAPDGQKIGFLGTGPGEVGEPLDIDIDRARQRIYVVDAKNDHIRVFTLEGQSVSTIGSSGNLNGQFNRPVSAWVDPPSGTLYVADFKNQRIQVFTNAGVFSNAFGIAGTGVGELMRPRGVAVDGQGRVLVSDAFQGWVQAFTSAGVYLGHCAFYGRDPGTLRNAGDIAVDSANRLLASSTGTKKVEAFNNMLGGSLTFPTTAEPARDAVISVPEILDPEASAIPIRVEIWGVNWHMVDRGSVMFNQAVKPALLLPATGTRPGAFDAVFRTADLRRWAKENKIKGSITAEITGEMNGGVRFAGSTVLVLEKGGGGKPSRFK